MPKRILIIGGTGRLGLPVARCLKSAGWTVRLLSRSPERARAALGEEFEIAGGNVEDSDTLREALKDCQALHISLDGRFDPDLERRAAENAVFASAGGRIERLSYLSGASVCEENCWYPGTLAKFQAERAIRASGIPYTIFRSHYFMEILFNFIRGKMALQIGRHPHPYEWVAAADFGRMVVRAYDLDEAANKTLYVCGPQALTMRQALEIFCREAHPEARQVYMPLWAAGIFARLGNRRELQAALPFFRYCEKVKTIRSGDPAEANALLGAPETTLETWSRAQART